MVKKVVDLALKERILSDIRRLSDGEVGIGIKKFLAITEYSEFQINKFFPRWSDALNAAGFSPNRFAPEPINENHLLLNLAELTRELGQVPTTGNLRIAAYSKEDFPSESSFKKHLGNKSEMIARLAAWITENPGFNDILELLPTETSDSKKFYSDLESSLPTSSSEGQTKELSDSLIPPIIECLPDMARNLPQIIEACKARNSSINTEFERRVAVAFELLGFSVERLGQGQGRKPDGIAICFENHYAIIYDAKVRTTEFRLDAGEDRKFKEYVKTAGERLRQQGIKKIYFAVISSGFYERDIPKAKEICRQTEAKSCILMEADALVGLVENGLRDVSRFNSEKLEKIFADETRILRANHI